MPVLPTCVLFCVPCEREWAFTEHVTKRGKKGKSERNNKDKKKKRFFFTLLCCCASGFCYLFTCSIIVYTR
ncbi:hypothetical protein TRSC58_07662 [Trypanosoma rangeli SC58]|uniref:Uncharacterized protein n=1 Tax=Trypanosoma rangeli SC58 TaxID=429131 RepID=A0A061IUR2_TRYRA|nr:hypothetical protein TRSC58_07662 [Trypanosoma rangeli SC58]